MPFKFENTSVYYCTDINITTIDYTDLYAVFYYYKVILLTVIFVTIVFVIYKSFWSPVFYKKELTDVGFDHISSGRDRAFHIQKAMNNRRMGQKCPPPYPNSWYALVETRDLKIGDVVPVDALGLNLVVYRGEDGTARVVDAYCPHLGAHLGVGGSVSDNCIRCPFHHWTFGENGDCVGMPGVDKVPKGIAIKTWPTMEVDGVVFFWYDAEGRPPLWTVEPCQDIVNWGYRGKSEFLVSAHLQELAENGADLAHLKILHSPSSVFDIGYKYPFLNKIIGRHVWDSDWSKSSVDHIAILNIRHGYDFMNINVLPFSVKGVQIGPAHVRIFYNSPVIGPAIVVMTTTPLGPLLQKVVYRYYTPFYNAPVGVALLYAAAIQFKRDVIVWNNKRYVTDPTYVKTDKSIREYRAWYLQFYSEHSISFKDALQNPLDW